MSGYIYAMQAGDFIKFGWAKDITKRRLQLQTGCPQRIEVIATAAWPRKFEHAIHAKLNDQRAHGEWFSVGGETNEVVRLMHQDDKDPIVPFLDAKLSKQGCVDGCRGKIGSGLISLLMEDPMTPTEQRVMGFLLLNMGYVNQVQASLCLIAGEIGVPKENVCRALKALQKRGVIVERKAKTFINAPIYVIDPSLYFCGTDDALAIAAAKFHKDLARASEARK